MLSKLCENRHPEEDRKLLAPNHIPSLEGLIILVVDDNADTLDMLTFVLEEYGVQVLRAMSASEALEAIAQFQPDIIISDIAMPGEDGYSLIRKIRTLEAVHLRQIPAIALTACAVEEERTLALNSGFQMHMPKPVDLSELVAVVGELAGRF